MMINEFMKGAMRGFGILLVIGSGIFAFQVSGTIKTWTTGETLTAADLNTTVQSLKTAVESASHRGEALLTGSPGSTFFRTFLGHSTAASTENLSQSYMNRSGNISSARLLVGSNTSDGTCTVTLRKNSADTNIQFSVPAASTAVVTDSDTVSYAPGDLLGWRIVCAGTSGVITVSSQFEF